MIKLSTLLTAVLAVSDAADTRNLRAQDSTTAGGGGPTTIATMAPQQAGDLNVHSIDHPFPLPRTKMPDGFDSKVEFQTMREEMEGGKTVFHERLVRCGVEKDTQGNELFPCNPDFDTRPFIKGLDRVGAGFNILTGTKTTPLFEWSIPAWFKPVYDSGRYNTDHKIPEQIVLTSLPSGEAGMSTEMFQSYEEYESKKSWGIGVSMGMIGLDESFALSKSTVSLRSAFSQYDVGISHQRYELYEMTIKPEIYGNCPYEEAVFSVEKDIVNTAAAAPAEDNGIVPKLTAKQVGCWLEAIHLKKHKPMFQENGIDGSFLLLIKNADMVDLEVTRQLDQHRFYFELGKLTKMEQIPDYMKEPLTTETCLTGVVEGTSDASKLDSSEKPNVERSERLYSPEPGTDFIELARMNSGSEPASEEPKKVGAVGAASEEPKKGGAVGAAVGRIVPSAAVNAGEIWKTTLGMKAKKGVRYAYGKDPGFLTQRRATKEHPVFVRRHLLRQGFLTAVGGLPVLANNQIHSVCADFDRDITATSMALKRGEGMSAEESTSASEAETEYRRFLNEWGTHFVESVVMGGDVQITSMVRRDSLKEKETKTLEANAEAEMDTQEMINDDDEEKQTEVETSDGSTNDDADCHNTDGEAGKSPCDEDKKTTSKRTVKETLKKKATAMMPAISSILGAVGTAGASMAAPLIAQVVENLKLKLSARYGSSASKNIQLNSKNNKNEVKFHGGDAQINGEEIGGDQFKMWKSTIRDDPVPVKQHIGT